MPLEPATRSSAPRKRCFRRGVAWRAGASLVVALGGLACTVVQPIADIPKNTARAMGGSESAPPVDNAEIQRRVLRFADDFNSQVAGGIDRYAREIGSPEAQLQGLRWKLSAVSSALNIASGSNPRANLIDMIALTTRMRLVLESGQVPEALGDALDNWHESSVSLEDKAWQMCDGVLDKKQQASLREAIVRYDADHAVNVATMFSRPIERTSLLRGKSTSESSSSGLLGFVGLDPFAGADPMVRELATTRLFAERAMFALVRLPDTTRWQVELYTTEALERPEVRSLIASTEQLSASADRISRATESISTAAAALPEQVAREREALVAAFEAHEGQLTSLAGELKETLDSGERMSTSLDQTLVTFDALMKRFGVGEPPSGAPVNPDAKPFDVSEYGAAAEQIALAARELDKVLVNARATIDSPALPQRVSDLDEFSERMHARVRDLENRAALLGAGLIVFATLCAFVYRRTAGRSAASESRKS